MIHTVTANPALDLTYRVGELKIHDTIRAKKVFRAAGGKGINVSRVAARLGHPTVAMGFTGGRAGDEIEELLSQEGIRTWFTRHQHATRTNVIIQDDEGQQIRVSGPGGEVRPEEIAALHSSIFDLRRPDFLVVSGSLLKGMPQDFYTGLIKEACKEGIKVAADADGDELKAAVAAGAYLVKPNHFELERLTGIKVVGAEGALRAAREVLKAGVTAVLASLGAEGAVLVSEGVAWRGVPPKVEVDSAVGSGDSMLAGALIARAEGADWAETLRLAVACGTATAKTPGTELCYPEAIREILCQVKLEPLSL